MVDRQAADRSQGRRRGGGDDQGRGPAVVAGDHHGQGQGVNNAEVAVPQPAGVAGRGRMVGRPQPRRDVEGERVEEEQEVVEQEEEEVVVQEELQLEELFHLAHRVLPDLPPSNPEAGDGWQAINRLGALKSFLCQFPLLQECPEQHKSAWAKAHGYVLQKWRAALTKEEVDTALLWLGLS